MGRGHYVQACHVVADIEAAMAEWLRTTGAGPFFVMSHVRPSNGRYRGQPVALEMTCAFAQAGPLQIELIEQHDAGPSVYRDMYAPGAGGFHHFCYWADGTIEAETAHYAALGIEPGYLASFGPLNFAYFDLRHTIGCFLEVLEREPGTVALFDAIAEAARDWNGSDPIRYLT
ncbi:hypothetical protein B2G71_16915 [Novosphingobium sp. PC22D]|uniref:VOC family protein n=1 Tax=Novosphingobium sp. PC22D TaxID=1962403 RepID=UPI000BF1B224|nr:VOC family protein [Novosphingobium sp. PC22D]PEQ11510.1 hypothetical protein B2G71_16915 [Novosphingobium sp. PC22D]